MRCSQIAIALSVSASLCGACASEPPSPVVSAGSAATGPRAEAQLQSSSGSNVQGRVEFRRSDGGLVAQVDLTGLPPNSDHGFHLHEKGDCSAPDASSAGPHFNPTGQPHGAAGSGAHHLGDLPSLHADERGEVHSTLQLPGLAIVGGPTSVVGRAVIVHADADDFTSQPAGNSGPRIACGVVIAKA